MSNSIIFTKVWLRHDMEILRCNSTEQVCCSLTPIFSQEHIYPFILRFVNKCIYLCECVCVRRYDIFSAVPENHSDWVWPWDFIMICYFGAGPQFIKVLQFDCISNIELLNWIIECFSQIWKSLLYKILIKSIPS